MGIFIMNGYDMCLERMYNDYVVLPSMDKR